MKIKPPTWKFLGTIAGVTGEVYEAEEGSWSPNMADLSLFVGRDPHGQVFWVVESGQFERLKTLAHGESSSIDNAKRDAVAALEQLLLSYF